MPPLFLRGGKRKDAETTKTRKTTRQKTSGETKERGTPTRRIRESSERRSDKSTKRKHKVVSPKSEPSFRDITNAIKSARIIGEEELKQRLERRKRLSKKRKFGKHGPRVRKKAIPETPVILMQKPKKRHKKTAKVVKGLLATVQARADRSGPSGFEIHVTSRWIFRDKNKEVHKKTIEYASKRVPEFVAMLQRKYRNRIDLLTVKVEYDIE